MIGAAVISVLGMVVCWLSAPVMTVWKMRTSRTVPVCPATVTTSPTRNGRSVTSITPDAMLDSESFSARPTARPAVPSTASSGVICTPSVPIASTTTITSDAAYTTLRRKLPSIGSTPIRAVARGIALDRRRATHMPTSSTTMAASNGTP
ncbi:hypothetical protein G6F35_012656 [Rhizopus arrhizus]|nr:hypothetical protein G6F35_012656 [Rhizopus arrhizus]